MENNLLLDHENAERILEEGWLLFQQKGYRGVTIDELCLRSHLSKPTLYYYFQDKENLFVSVLQYKLLDFRKAVEQPGTLTQRLECVAVAILDSFKTEYSALMHDREHIKKTENLRKIREAFYNDFFGPLLAIMQLGIDQNELNGDSSEMLTLIFLGMVNNFIGKSGEMNISNAEIAHKLLEYFLYGAKKL